MKYIHTENMQMAIAKRALPEPFSSRLKRALNSKGVSGSDLARAVGITPNAVSHWRHGGAPKPEKMKEVEAYFGHHLEGPFAYVEPDSAPDPHVDVKENVATVLQEARIRIALIAGLKENEVKIHLELKPE